MKQNNRLFVHFGLHKTIPSLSLSNKGSPRVPNSSKLKNSINRASQRFSFRWLLRYALTPVCDNKKFINIYRSLFNYMESLKWAVGCPLISNESFNQLINQSRLITFTCAKNWTVTVKKHTVDTACGFYWHKITPVFFFSLALCTSLAFNIKDSFTK